MSSTNIKMHPDKTHSFNLHHINKKNNRIWRVRIQGSNFPFRDILESIQYRYLFSEEEKCDRRIKTWIMEAPTQEEKDLRTAFKQVIFSSLENNYHQVFQTDL